MSNKYTENDNRGTRLNTLAEVSACWNMRNVQQKYDPFLLYAFSTVAEAYNALLGTGYIYQAADSRQLICTEPIYFGYYPTAYGSFEVILAGEYLSPKVWLKARDFFLKSGGLCRNEQEPVDQSRPQATAIPQPATVQAVKAEPKAQPAPEIKAKPEIKTETKAQPAPEIKAKPEIKAETKAKPAPEAKAKPEVKAETKAQPAPVAKAEPELKKTPDFSGKVKSLGKYSKTRQSGVVSTYEEYECEDVELAKEFLQTKSVSVHQYYIVVATPKGIWGTDIEGLYKERLLPWQYEIGSAAVEGSAIGFPNLFSLNMAARKISDNFIVSVECGSCKHDWIEALRYQDWTVVECPICHKLNKINSDRFNVFIV
jgi:hypothetical protein